MKTSQQKLTQFLIFTFAFSWLIWLPGVLTSFGVITIPSGLIRLLELVGAIGPAVAALYLTGRHEGKPGLKRVLISSFNVKAHWRFWLGAVAMLLALHAVARLLYSLIEPNLPQSDLLQSPIAIIPIFIVMFLVGGGLGEEIGWRGYALDLIQEKQTVLIASLLLFMVWSVWHFPLFFMSGTNQSLIPIWLWLLPVLPLSVMLTWVYNNTHTIFAAAMFHTIGNLSHELFRVVPTETSPNTSGFVILTVLYYVAAIAIVGIYGAKTLRRERK
jgi:membrane protease YdiL (CAAX protease family)